MKAKVQRKREPYDKPRIFHDSFETFSFTPDKEEREAFRNMRKAKDRMAWLKRHQERWEKEHAEWLKKRHAEILQAVEQDKVILAMERAFSQHVQQIQDYYRAEHEKEARNTGQRN